MAAVYEVIDSSDLTGMGESQSAARMVTYVNAVHPLADIHDGPQRYVPRAAIAALRTWVADGDAPASAPRLEVDGGAIARDARGIALGGIRTPAVDAPASILTGEAPPGESIICSLFGETRPLDPAALTDLCPTHDDYIDAVTTTADDAVTAGHLLPDDATEIIATAEDANVPR